jgi:predicted ester cyclase
MSSPLQVYSAFQQTLQSHDYEQMGDVVDLVGYTENCLGLTGWTTGFEVALGNWNRNILSAFSDMKYVTEDVVEGSDALTVRSRVEATHTGTFLGLEPTGRRIAWDYVAIVHVEHGKVIGQWIQPDLWGIYQQLTTSAAERAQPLKPQSELAWAESAR